MEKLRGDLKPLNIPVSVSGAYNTGVTDSAGNTIHREYAQGGIVRGPGTGTSDSILARLSNGEFVMRRDAVLRYELRHLEEMNRLRAPRYADGGLVASSATRVFNLPNLPERKASGPMTTVNIHLPGGASFPMQATPDIGVALQKALAMESLKNGSLK